MASPKKARHVEPLDTLLRHLREARAACTEELGVEISKKLTQGGAISDYNELRSYLPNAIRNMEWIKIQMAEDE